MRMMFAVLSEMSATDGCIVTFCADIHCAPRVCPNNYSDTVAFPLCHHQVKYLNLCRTLGWIVTGLNN